MEEISALDAATTLWKYLTTAQIAQITGVESVTVSSWRRSSKTEPREPARSRLQLAHELTLQLLENDPEADVEAWFYTWVPFTWIRQMNPADAIKSLYARGPQPDLLLLAKLGAGPFAVASEQQYHAQGQLLIEPSWRPVLTEALAYLDALQKHLRTHSDALDASSPASIGFRKKGRLMLHPQRFLAVLADVAWATAETPNRRPRRQSASADSRHVGETLRRVNWIRTDPAGKFARPVRTPHGDVSRMWDLDDLTDRDTAAATLANIALENLYDPRDARAS